MPVVTLPLAATVLLCLMCLAILIAGVTKLVVVRRGAAHAEKERLRIVAFDENILLASDLVPDVSVIAVAPDASEATFRFVRQLVKLYFGRFEVMVVLDGPSSEDLEAWKREFHLQPAVRVAAGTIPAKPVRGMYCSTEPIPLFVVDKQAGSEADGLNAALNLVTSRMVAMVDWNTEFSSDALMRLIEPVIDDPQTAVSVGLALPAPGKSLASRIYRSECLRNWLGRCAGLAASDAILSAPGAFILFRRDALVAAGGFRRTRGGCALEMMLHLHKLALDRGQPCRVRLIADAIARPASPNSSRELRKRLSRDQMEVAGALRLHRKMMFAAGKVGDWAIPGLFCSRLLLPLLETATLILAAVSLGMGWINPLDIALLMYGMVAFGILVSMTMVLLEPAMPEAELPARELGGFFLSAVWEHLGYRQLRNLRFICDFARGWRIRRPE